MTQTPQSMDHARTFRGRVQLLATCLGIALIWCIALPSYAKRPSMQQHLKRLDDHGIDPSAMFYTELDYMDSILKDL